MPLDPLIHAPVRLSVMAALAHADAVEFAFLVEHLGVSDSLLSKHVAKLEDAGLVQSSKRKRGNRHYTWLKLTSAGRRAFGQYTEELETILAPPSSRTISGEVVRELTTYSEGTR